MSLIGQQLGDYRILEPIGSGGMGQVYLAEHVHLRKKYAVKVLPAELAQDRDFAARFHDEARVMAELRHDRIVLVHNSGHVQVDTGDGVQEVYFLVMDYVTGPEGKPLSLHDHLKTQPEGRLPQEQVRKWAIQIAEALAYAHEKGVVHRDIKPANILIDPNNDVKLTDFGLAKAIGTDFINSQIHQTMRSLGSMRTLKAGTGAASSDHSLGSAATLSPDGSHRTSSASSLLGTYDYMAPEQRGEYSGKIDQRTDIYALGIVLYRLLTGRRPTGMAKPPSQVVAGIPESWDDMITQCTADSPSERPENASAVLAALRRAGGREPRRKAVLAGLVVLMLVTVGGIAAYRTTNHQPAGSTPATPPTLGLSRAADQPSTAAPLAATQEQPGAKSLEPDALTAAEVIPLETVAEKAIKEVESVDRKHGLGELLDKAQNCLINGKKFKNEKMWVQAKENYDLATQLCHRIKSSDRERSLAIDAEQASRSSRQLAQTGQADAIASKLWESAEKATAQARRIMESNKLQFNEARQFWAESKSKYDESANAAKSSKERVKNAVHEYESSIAGSVELLRSWGGKEWASARALANAAAEQWEKLHNVDQTVAAYANAKERANTAITAAQSRKKNKDEAEALEFARLRDEADAAKLAAENSMKSAKHEGADTVAAVQWQIAEQLRAKAQSANQVRAYEESKQLWNQAKANYDDALSRARTKVKIITTIDGNPEKMISYSVGLTEQNNRPEFMDARSKLLGGNGMSIGRYCWDHGQSPMSLPRSQTESVRIEPGTYQATVIVALSRLRPPHTDFLGRREQKVIIPVAEGQETEVGVTITLQGPGASISAVVNP